MKLYTKTGDKGRTGLFGGVKVAKDHPRVCAYGQVDETNAAIGMVTTACNHAETVEKLREVQRDLLTVGAVLATPSPKDKVPAVTEDQIARVEGWIDEADSRIPKLTGFVLPGGTEEAVRLHMARTICRRAERSVVALISSEPVDERVLVYLNRLGDLLFALARCANHRAGVADVTWNDSPE